MNFPDETEASLPDLPSRWREASTPVSVDAKADPAGTDARTISGGSRGAEAGTSPNASSEAMDMPVRPAFEVELEFEGARRGDTVYGGSPLVNLRGMPGTPTSGAALLAGVAIPGMAGHVFSLSTSAGATPPGGAWAAGVPGRAPAAPLFYGSTPFGKSIDMVDMCAAIIDTGAAADPVSLVLGGGAPDDGIMFVEDEEMDADDGITFQIEDMPAEPPTPQMADHRPWGRTTMISVEQRAPW